jgi:hypothetical protein
VVVLFVVVAVAVGFLVADSRRWILNRSIWRTKTK